MTLDSTGKVALPRTVHVCCPNCGNINIRPISPYAEHNIWRCAKCSLVFDKRIPSEADLAKHYNQYSYSMLKECSSFTILSYNNLLDEFEEYWEMGRMLDYGCGQGDFLATAKKRDWMVTGVEYSPAARKLCADRGLNVASAERLNAEFDGIQFDVITSFEVIEHLSSANSLFEMVSRKLRVGGLFYLTTPNFNALLRYLEGKEFQMIGFPEHLTFYTKPAITSIAERFHFRSERIITTGLDFARLKTLFLRKGPVPKEVDWVTVRLETERLRQEIHRNAYLRFFKAKINSVLSFFGIGDTLKCYLVKLTSD
jgi:2-polyprenyl-3-methyl-5-hydroxy-6-metoxy-1,4-benzoquinol methylase